MKKTISVILVILLLIGAVTVYGDEIAINDAVAQGEAGKPAEVSDLQDAAAQDFVTKNKSAILSALYEADISEIRAALDAQLITCRELTQYYLDRIEKYNKPFNCFITICDNAIEEADKRDEQIKNGTANGALFGIPVVVKDNLKYVGYPTTNGTKKKTVYDENAAAVTCLLEQGAVILAKTNMSTNAQEARITISKAVGQTYNAYNTKLASGGSSGGSAVATSLNFAAASLGTDTNSSLRYPAALNGCVSMRPTVDLVNNDGCIILNTKRDTVGSITRSVPDQAIMLDVLTGGKHGYADNLNPEALAGMKIGVLKELSGPLSTSASRKNASIIDSEVIAAFENTIAELRECGAEIVTVSMPKVLSYQTNCSKNNATAMNTFYQKLQLLFDDNEVSAVIFPTYLTTPQVTGTNSSGGLRVYDDDQPVIGNCPVISPCTGTPELSIQIGVHSNGAGIGLEILGLKNSEQTLLDIAYSYTLKYDHRVTPTTAPDTYSDSNIGSVFNVIEELNKVVAAVTAEAVTASDDAGTTAVQTEDRGDKTDAYTDGEYTVSGDDTDDGSHKSKWILIAVVVIAVIIIVIIIIINRRRRQRMIELRRKRYQMMKHYQ